MPIYEFRCKECEEVESKFGHMTSPPQPSPCVKCGGETCRIFSVYSVGVKTRRIEDIAKPMPREWFAEQSKKGNDI